MLVDDDVIIDDVITVGNMQISYKYHKMAQFGRKIAILRITSIARTITDRRTLRSI